MRRIHRTDFELSRRKPGPGAVGEGMLEERKSWTPSRKAERVGILLPAFQAAHFD